MPVTKRMRRVAAIGVAAVLAGAMAVGTGPFTDVAKAHCDTMDGPVVTAGRRALAERDVRYVLGWVRAEDEAQIRAAFERTVRARRAAAARDVADQWFFETLVRVHRAGEGAPFTGIEPAGTDAGAAIRTADRAL